MSEGKPRIIIVGGGFGGIKLAKLFANEKVEVTLVDRRNFHLFQPLLYQVSTSVLESGEIAYPIRTFFRSSKNVNFYMAKAQGVNQSKNILFTDRGDILYDYLVLAAGSTTNFFGMKNVERYAFGMKTIREAENIRNHIISVFERADKPYLTAEDRTKLLTFVVVGGGPTGVEEAGAIAELIEIQKKEFHKLDFSEVSVKLIEATSNILPVFSEDLQKYAINVLEKKGIEVILDTQVIDYDGEVLELGDKSAIPTVTVIWAAGVRAVDFMQSCGGECARDGRIWVKKNLMVRNAINKNVFAIGDCAAFMHYDMKQPLPTVATVANQEAVIVFKNIMKLVNGEGSLEEFHYKDLGAMATIGRGRAIVSKPHLTGFLAWCLWMFVHLLRLSGIHSNITVALKWTWNLISGTRLGRIITNI